MSGKLPNRGISSLIGATSSVRGSLVAIAIPLAFGMTLAQGAERSGESIAKEVCVACHKTGEKGAPVIGDKAAWAKRKTQGLTNLGQHAVEGIRNMPAHGGNAGLSSPDLERAITYMVNQSGGNWTEPVNKTAPQKARSGAQLVKAKCGDCHLTGANGAPKIGDRDAWVNRVSGGLDKVIASGIHGRGAMPPRGGLADITDEEMKSAVVYMFTESTAPKKK